MLSRAVQLRLFVACCAANETCRLLIKHIPPRKNCIKILPDARNHATLPYRFREETMGKALQILAALTGAFFLIFMGGNWVINPEGAATGLQMIYMDGAARNSQIGDLGALFLCMGGFALFGVWKKRPDFLYASACLTGMTAVMRVYAGLVHDAPTIWDFVVVEIIAVAIWVAHARKLQS